MELKSEDKLLRSRAEDTLERCSVRRSVCVLGFLTPAERGLLERTLPKSSDVCCTFWGGFDDAERTMLVCYPDGFARMGIAGSADPLDGHHSDQREPLKFEVSETPISVLRISGREIVRLNHRDFLGSVLGLGIKREKIGDILVGSERCFMFVSTDIAEYICENLSKIGNAGVSVELADVSEVELPARSVEEIVGTVANVRLDAVLGVALKVSRSRAAELISAGVVVVNWEIAASVAKLVSSGDVFSVKGFGRFRLSEIGGLSKKNRTYVTIEKYL